MKKLLILITVMFFTVSSAMADFTFYAPTKPGSGFDQWIQVVLKELRNHTDEKITVKFIPGARGRTGLNEWENNTRHNDPDGLQASGGTAASNWLYIRGIEYDFENYSGVGIQLLDILVGKAKDWNPKTDKLTWGNESALGDTLGMITMICGNLDGKIESFKTCVDNKLNLVKGMGDGPATMAFMRGEFQVFRGNPTAWAKKMSKITTGELWYTQGVFDRSTGKAGDNPNHPGMDFDSVFKKTWGEAPKSEMYDAYRLSQTWNDAVQKAIWIQKDNPRKADIVKALKKMLADPESQAALKKASGGSEYGWAVGEEADQVIKQIKTMVTENTLKNTVWIIKEVFDYDVVYIPERVHNK
jgi:hypothetical protein